MKHIPDELRFVWSIASKCKIHIPQVRMEHSQGWCICGDTKQVSTKKIEIIASIFPITMVQTRNQLQEENWKNHKYVVSKQHAPEQLSCQWRSQRRNLKDVKANENEDATYQNSGCSKNTTKREFYNNTGLPQETRKTLSNNLTYT